jgi:hypothetical protein
VHVCVAIVPSAHAQDDVVPGVQSVAVSVPVSSAAEQAPPSASIVSGTTKRQAATRFEIMDLSLCFSAPFIAAILE